jgi:hypothetical protein
METLVYRTDDLTRWGTGQGSNLTADQVDRNFFAVFSAISALEDHQQSVAQIASMHAVGNQLYITLTDASVIGPIEIPTSNWNFRADGWLPSTNYAAYDVFNYNGGTYLVLVDHVSDTTFSPFATDGNGHDLYGLLLENAQNMLPDNGTVGQRLVKQAGSPFDTAWQSDKVRMAWFIEGLPDAGERFGQYVVVDNCTLPVGLTGSVGYSRTPPLVDQSITINLNGSPIGTFDFAASPADVTATFSSAIDLVPGDVLDLVAPNTQDAQFADISVVLVALLTE